MTAVNVLRYVAALALGDWQVEVRLRLWLLGVSLDAPRRPLGQEREKRDIDAHPPEVCLFDQRICFFRQAGVLPL